ncbi:putative RNA 2'-phosphotransferase [Pararobbsia alpina]|uniref:RNA 2'-phosphotransferase n=1 Tax=Pararobbsia alpina TaxID=621374 RepID=UPI0039A763C1
MEASENSSSSGEHSAVSRLLSKILRHEPELVGVTLDPQGWVGIDELIRAIDRAAKAAGASKRLRTLPPITKDLIYAVVAQSDKQRFSLSPDRMLIRAAQGHSVSVDLGYVATEPPAVLYHGTARTNLASISREGLNPGSRHAVHLSIDVATATRVGARHGAPVVLVVDAARMHADGFEFFCSENGVWLTAHVPVKYLDQLGTNPGRSTSSTRAKL